MEASIRFYHDLMGFDPMTRYGRQAAFLSPGGYHHHIGLNTWESLNGQPPAPGATGLYHFAILYPARKDLATALKRLLDGGSSIAAGRSTARPTTARTKRSIYMTRTSTA